MKKIFFAAVFCFFALSGANAQVTFKPGVKAGLNFSRLTNSDVDSKTDFYFGGLLSIKLTKFYTLQPELVYSRQGAKRIITFNRVFNTANDPGFLPDNEVKYSLDYLSLGVINKFTFGKGIHVVIGPSLDFKVNDNFNSIYSDKPVSFDFCIISGLGYSLPNGLTFDARFKQGMVDVFGHNNYDSNNTNSNVSINEVVLNQLFQIGVSYSFDIK